MEIQVRLVELKLNPNEDYKVYVEITNDKEEDGATYITPELFQISFSGERLKDVDVKPITDPVIYVV